MNEQIRIIHFMCFTNKDCEWNSQGYYWMLWTNTRNVCLSTFQVNVTYSHLLPEHSPPSAQTQNLKTKDRIAYQWFPVFDQPDYFNWIFFLINIIRHGGQDRIVVLLSNSIMYREQRLETLIVYYLTSEKFMKNKAGDIIYRL